MLNLIRQQLKNAQSAGVVAEATTRSNGADAVKRVFLDTVGTETLGAENDPKIRDLINSIPEYEDGDGATVKDIESLTESLLADLD